MATETVASPSAEPVDWSLGRRGATRVAEAVLGTLVGLAGVEHGIGEVLQRPVAPDGLSNLGVALWASHAQDRLQTADR